MSKKLSLLGYLILFTFIFFLISSFFKDQTIYIEAGPKSGFFDTSDNDIKKRLKDYNIDAEVIMILGLSALSRNKIGLKNIPPPIPTIPDINPKIDPMIKQINLGNDL